MSSLPTTLLEYYTTNYTKCQQSFSIFSTPEFLSVGAKSQFFVIIPINLFGFYCIICKTPKYMKEFQFHLFHMQFWFLILTIFYTILTTPYHFYPAEVRCSVGLFRDLGISSRYQVYLINLVYGGIVSAVILLFENRHRHLVPSTDIFYNIKGFHRFFLGFFNFFVGSSNLWSVMLQDANQETLKLEYLKILPCPTELYFDSCSSAVERNPNIWNLGLLITSILIPIQVIFFIIHSFMYLRKSQNINSFSKRTKKLQKAFFRAGIAQVASPISVLIIPLALLIYIMGTRQYLPGLINICILFIPSHSVFSTFAIIIFNVPYRNYVKKILGIGQDNSISRVAIVSSF
ncbi:CRE-SRH-49 protein [Caenorhabditis remanei]|uniref:CRE-SRH-49 protein n=1 Tax=Caenorhabditis remanei TaxID=31234 RepID=E3LUY8_CAERE|nr:CRE-SRH-49 protein [Caenorhabditis remanei]